MKIPVCWVMIATCLTVQAHQASEHIKVQPNATQDEGEVRYLGNAGLWVSHGQLQVMFDPFFHNHYGQYQLVPESIRADIFAGKAPFDAVEMILISHAHEDHFDATDLLKYLTAHQNTRLLAPQQAIDQLQKLKGFANIQPQVLGFGLNKDDEPVSHELDGIRVEAVRIPHAGWPARADVANLVYRVTLNDQVTVMHLGDADPDDVHFEPFKSHWESQSTDRAYPPYWFMLVPDGQAILANRIHARRSTGVHVPVKVPESLQHSGADYFSIPGSTHTIKTNTQGSKQ